MCGRATITDCTNPVLPNVAMACVFPHHRILLGIAGPAANHQAADRHIRTIVYGCNVPP